jgi:hypothetical protein
MTQVGSLNFMSLLNDSELYLDYVQIHFPVSFVAQGPGSQLGCYNG